MISSHGGASVVRQPSSVALASLPKKQEASVESKKEAVVDQFCGWAVPLPSNREHRREMQKLRAIRLHEEEKELYAKDAAAQVA
eukprot:m.334102 g.334102  ORF g.334102 m.334102 type:complete len:84 (+) comp17289_c0_seq1:212-463(+)